MNELTLEQRDRLYRISQVHWAMPPTTGGVESHVADLAAALTAQGCEVTVITGERNPSPLPSVEIISTPLLDLGVLQEMRGNGGLIIHELQNELERLFQKYRFQIIHGHNLHHFFPEPALVMKSLRKKYSLSIFHTFHETWPDLLNTNPVYREWDGNYATSRFVQNECALRLGFRPELKPLGVDTDRFRPQRTSMTNVHWPIILHPARVLPWKGVHVSIDMLGELRKRGISAHLIVTDTPKIIDWDHELVEYKRQILRRVHEYGINDRVEFRSVAYRDIHLLYDQADIVIYPTVGDEPYGLVPLEAMSCERPIIASHSGGISETVIDGVTGYLVKKNNAIELADRIEFLLKNPYLCRRFGTAGRRHVIDNFSVAEYATWILKKYSRRASTCLSINTA